MPIHAAPAPAAAAPARDACLFMPRPAAAAAPAPRAGHAAPRAVDSPFLECCSCIATVEGSETKSRSRRGARWLGSLPFKGTAQSTVARPGQRSAQRGTSLPPSPIAAAEAALRRSWALVRALNDPPCHKASQLDASCRRRARLQAAAARVTGGRRQRSHNRQWGIAPRYPRVQFERCFR